ncbi:uncharacterized protein GGS22DRAFT_158715 [Annulohypoxylon maeteangense]|uniref:uncharacterized protein n=1 Tax=Annulohypoxylon maeteangense TaxID=1927788 RepID=UPI0020076648|nr:uncharacterized protein GGS22DRAFT_158715 [Annulohypoxylon maeteangense]KAI0886799.1 hypothetical protein GGS22DRAFT_158715 [Annulohypoxylon maeteangense]
MMRSSLRIFRTTQLTVFTQTTRSTITIPSIRTMSSSIPPPNGSSKAHFPPDSSLPGERFEVRQTHPTGDYTPIPSKSFPLSASRQALLDDIIALYEMKPTVSRVRRYTPDCVYNDQFVYADDRYKMAGQWFALPKLFHSAESRGYQVVTNDRDLIQFRHEEASLVLNHGDGWRGDRRADESLGMDV